LNGQATKGMARKDGAQECRCLVEEPVVIAIYVQASEGARPRDYFLLHW
jgi:hypothetical protein